MPTTEMLRRRMAVARSLGSIVRTMKLLAASGIRPFEDAVAALREYQNTLELGLQVVLRSRSARQRGDRGLGRGAERGPPRLAAILFGSDHGMCGRFNEEIAELAAAELGAGGRELPILALGLRLPARLEVMGVRCTVQRAMPATVAGVAAAVDEVLLVLDEWRAERGVDHVTLLWHQAGAPPGPRFDTLLPLPAAWLDELAGRPWPGRSIPVVPGESALVLSALTRQHVVTTLFRTFAESLAAEHAGRLHAMQAAERNIQRRVDALDALYHRQRQEEITEQTLEVMAGFHSFGDDGR